MVGLWYEGRNESESVLDRPGENEDEILCSRFWGATTLATFIGWEGKNRGECRGRGNGCSFGGEIMDGGEERRRVTFSFMHYLPTETFISRLVYADEPSLTTAGWMGRGGGAFSVK
jgi:hypothetical protein